jgi:DNA-binding NarL/FixJ family response regulator
MIRVVLADDHTLVRESLGHIINFEDDMEVVGMANDGIEAIEEVERLQPDIVLLDIQMPNMDGITACRRIRAQWPQVHIGLLTGLDGNEALFQSMLAGADAFVLKDSGRAELLKAIRRMAEGDTHLAGDSLRTLVREFRRLHQLAGQQREPLPATLSDREREVLRLVVEGNSNKEIARQLGVEISTVKSHLHNAFEKIGVQDRTQAAVLCMQNGWFRPISSI